MDDHRGSAGVLGAAGKQRRPLFEQRPAVDKGMVPGCRYSPFYYASRHTDQRGEE